MFNNVIQNNVNDFYLTTSAGFGYAEVEIVFTNKWDENDSFTSIATLSNVDKFFLTYQLPIGNVEIGKYDYQVFQNGEIIKVGRVDIEFGEEPTVCILLVEVSIIDANIDLSPNFEIDLEDGEGCNLYEIIQSSL